jgi:hypothetical protein
LAGGALTGVGTAAAGLLTNPAGALNSLTGMASSALGKLTGIASGGLDSLTKGLQSGKDGLASLASAGLPASAAAALAASMNALSSSSPFPIKMPSVATGTSDRGELASAITSVLGSAIIPAPEYSNAPSQAELDEKLKRLDQVRTLRETYQDAAEKFNTEWKIRQDKSLELIEEYKTAKNNLPEGDPEIAAIRSRNKPIVDANNKWKDEEWDRIQALRKAWLEFNF